jgi:hypothetical protein
MSRMTTRSRRLVHVTLVLLVSAVAFLGLLLTATDCLTFEDTVFPTRAANVGFPVVVSVVVTGYHLWLALTAPPPPARYWLLAVPGGVVLTILALSRCL